MQLKARGCHDSQRRIWWLCMAWRRMHRVHSVTFTGPQRRKRTASLTAKTCRSCVVQREEDAKRHGERRDLRLEIAVSPEISAYTPSHRHPAPPLPPSSVLYHASASCTRSVGANAALLLWDSFQPQDGVSLRSVHVFATGCVLRSA